MKSIQTVAASLLAFGMLVAVPVQADKPEHAGKPDKHAGMGNDGGGKRHKGNSGKDSGDILQRAIVDRLVLDRYGKQYKVKGNKPLPPGIRKNLARGKPIPPGIARTRLPQGYVNSLPRYQGYEWRGYGSDLVLVHLLSDKIADVLVDALR